MYFQDRSDAARQLADALRGYGGRNPLVLAIPRGAVPMARLIADRLGGDLDVVLVRKLGAPTDPELAIGAVDESGWVFLPDEIADCGLDPAYVRGETARQLDVIARRRAGYTPGRKPLDPKGRIAIVVDDGLATGATMMAALHAVRGHEPGRLVCAVPVASRHALSQVRRAADEVVCLAEPGDFHAVGQFYGRFDPVEDAEVIRVLRAGATPRAAAAEKGIA